MVVKRSANELKNQSKEMLKIKPEYSQNQIKTHCKLNNAG
jgi:hypothetical protein